MIGGLDKYFQIAHCFRDEDLRADRQPEFTQLDVEMSLRRSIRSTSVIEGLFASVFKLINVELPAPFPRFTFAEVMNRALVRTNLTCESKDSSCRIWQSCRRH
jgi:aspartyl-tRNA synthetase